MAVKIYWLHKFDNSAQVGIMARPRGNEWLEEEILSLKKQHVHVVLSLLEKDEIHELGLRRQPELCLKHNIRYLSFPIPDRDVPSRDKRFFDIIAEAEREIAEGRSIVIHCRMGIGRSSIVAGSLLLKAGFGPGDIFAHISKMRGLRVPDTEEQVKWLI
ncbi:protein-tyrosine phosphatase family protein [Chitinophaga barathri]|uniref:Protein tyrosine phosphatase n=1 Tax=Chitinophaga barathri TaxID=1647451 RepID=A0A3N4MDA4_9BACT|nr:protein-tyrosine phosphatase family protein [Chitinophaga barathri]RPD39557.1 protein tyrosine phosphatase [Chitinophaga barathri]